MKTNAWETGDVIRTLAEDCCDDENGEPVRIPPGHKGKLLHLGDFADGPNFAINWDDSGGIHAATIWNAEQLDKSAVRIGRKWKEGG